MKEGGNDKERRYVSRADMIRRSLAIDMGADIDVDDVDDVDDDIETEKIKEEEEVI